MLLRLVPVIVLMIMLLPIAGGLIGTLLPAFGYLPALGFSEFGLQPWRDLFAWPGLSQSLWLTLFTGFGASLVSFLTVQLLLGLMFGSRWLSRLTALASPIMAVPHAAMAVGLVFLIAPSGWAVRLFSPGMSGFNRPPDWLIIGDEWGLSLLLGLVIKELPYLLLMSLAALSQIPAQQSLKMGQSLGHSRLSSWFRLILPQLYPHLRLPLFAVLAFSLSVVDMALILGPNTPPPFAVQVLRWFSDPELNFRLVGSAAAILLMLVLIIGLGCWLLAERLIWLAAQNWLVWGPRKRRAHHIWLERSTGVPSLALLALGLLALVPLALWSVARRWRFPDTLPSRWSLQRWQSNADSLIDSFGVTLWIAVVATVIGLVLTLLSLEKEQRMGRNLTRGTEGLKYLPLLVPQIAFLFGVQVLAIVSGVRSVWVLVIWGHLIYVLPYCFISLSAAYAQLDPKMLRIGSALGAGPWRIFWRIKLPLLLPAIATAAAIAMAVSVAQYLPTVLLSGGSLSTLTTETVSLSSGADRRVLAVFALSQALLPCALLLAAVAIPRLVYFNRKGMLPS